MLPFINMPWTFLPVCLWCVIRITFGAFWTSRLIYFRNNNHVAALLFLSVSSELLAREFCCCFSMFWRTRTLHVLWGLSDVIPRRCNQNHHLRAHKNHRRLILSHSVQFSKYRSKHGTTVLFCQCHQNCWLGILLLLSVCCTGVA